VNLNLSHRAPTGRATIVRDKKSLVNLGRNLMQPLLGAICPILIIPEIGREFVYPAVGDSKLICKFCSGPLCRLEVRLSCIVNDRSVALVLKRAIKSANQRILAAQCRRLCAGKALTWRTSRSPFKSRLSP